MRRIALRASTLPRYKVGMAVEEILEAESGDLTIPITPDSILLYPGVSY
jgi:hypothetical protein